MTDRKIKSIDYLINKNGNNEYKIKNQASITMDGLLAVHLLDRWILIPVLELCGFILLRMQSLL